MTSESKRKLYLIVTVTPQFLERGALWFKESEQKILHARKTQPWWEENTLVLEKDANIGISETLRKLTDLGYEKTQTILSPGEFSQSGDTIRVSAINREDILRIEFHGTLIEAIHAKFLPALQTKKVIPPKRHFREKEFVVHLDHGIGIYCGFENNYHVIEYARPRPTSPPDRLLVPIDQEKKLSLYIGFDHPTIHRLGGELWPRTKRKIKESAEILARELLALYAKREIAERAPFRGDPSLERAFAETFPFVETPSQLESTAEIIRDLEAARPMDRLLVGDVGFGKTEVAMRAALHVAASGYQVAVLSPTTILTDQHRGTFAARFEAFPISTAALSRLTPPTEEKEILAKLEKGEIDIVIGTHRLLSKDIVIPKLGLLIIDEEQKFGVRAKEHFTTLRASLDVLSLSATPIPRTLSLALAKLRGVSEIRDPPPERIAVKNFVLPRGEKIIKEAIETELARDGQVYVLHNRVATILLEARKLQELIPSAAIGIIHGRMEERELLRELEKFRNKETNVLLATTIIENGLDFSNVNTLIVENATRLGLSQAYQIRGRIGRAAREAFAYFLYPAQNLSDEARERLETLEAFEALGSGYEIALRDLEMRGAGAVLGKEQSGAVQKGGLNLYMQLLSDALEELKAAA